MSLPQTATSSRHQTTHSNPIFPKAGADPLNSILVATNSFLGSVSAENKFNVAYQTSVLSDHILASILLSDGSRGLDFQQILTPLLTSMGIPPGQVNQAFLKTFSDHLEDYRRDLLKKQEIIRLQKQVRQTIGDNKVTPREYIKHLNEQGSSVQEQFTNALSSSTASSADLPPVFDQTPSFTQEAWTTTPTPTLTSEPSTSYFSPSVSDQESRSDQSSFSPPSINQIKNAAEFLKNPSLTNAFKSFGKGGLSQALKGASQLGKAGLQAGKAALAAGKAALAAGKAAAVAASAGLVAALPYIAAGIAVTVVLAVIIAIFVPEVSKWFAVDPSDIAAMQADSISGQMINQGTAPNCSNEIERLTIPKPTQPIAARAWEIVDDLSQGIWCYWNWSKTDYPDLFDESLLSMGLSDSEMYTHCYTDGCNIFWCTWLIIKSYTEAGYPINTDSLWVPDQVAYFQSTNRYIEASVATHKASPNQVVPGSVVFFHDGTRASHVAIVVDVNKDYITFVQSNGATKTGTINFKPGGIGVNGVGWAEIIGFSRP